MNEEDSFTVSKGTWYKEEQIIHILKEVEIDSSVAQRYWKYGVAEQTVYRLLSNLD